MKKFLFVIIAGALLMSGCNDLEIDNKSSLILPPNEIGTQISGQSAAEITGSEPILESSEAQNLTESQATSTSEPMVYDNTSEDTSCSYTESVQEAEVSLSNSESESDTSSNASEKTPETSSTESTKESELPSSTSESESNTSSNISEKAPETSEISSIVSDNDWETKHSTSKEEIALEIEITVNGRTFSATLYDNETAAAFKERLPLALDMSELNGNEKYYYLPQDLPTNSSRPSGIHIGDIMLYGNSCLVLFYEDFSTSYSYTPIGRIDDPDGLAAALGSGNVQIIFN